jgi:signal transduction histidine kinase
MVFALLIVLLFYLRSKLKKQQRELIEANKAVKLTNENLENIVMERTYLLNKTFNELDTVLYKASHDLRAPLSSMAGIIDLISRETNNTELTGLLVKTNERMDKMLKKLSTISEIHQPGDFEKVHIKKICEDVFSNFRSLVEERKIDFETNINVGRNVVSIAKLLEVIIYHLLDNALFFCWINNDNSRKVNLEIQTSEEKLTIKISNNGITVDENIKDKIFEMFYVGSELSTGNGLGLYIVQKSVDLLDGKVELSVDQANHTVFTVQIPLNGKGSSTLAFLGNIKTK